MSIECDRAACCRSASLRSSRQPGCLARSSLTSLRTDCSKDGSGEPGGGSLVLVVVLVLVGVGLGSGLAGVVNGGTAATAGAPNWSAAGDVLGAAVNGWDNP